MKAIRSFILSAAFIVLGSVSTGVSAQSIAAAVEYKFDNPATDDGTTPNTGTGDSSSSSSLDGILFPESGNGINASVSPSDGGFDGTPVAQFTGHGCIQVPYSHDVNALYSRVISLNFKRSGEDVTRGNTRVLYEEGSNYAGLNIYLLQLNATLRTARLFMAAWNNYGRSSSVIRTTQPINDLTWYSATMVLDAQLGTLSGYIDDVKFGEEPVVFFPLLTNTPDSCLGGHRKGTTIFFPDDASYGYYGDAEYQHYRPETNGLFFKGEIDNFQIRNQLLQPTVEYLFDTDAPKENTGTGNNLNGKPRPRKKSNNGIVFEGTGASFDGKGCIRVPNSDDVNKSPVSDRTISLQFKWDGTDDTDHAEILFEEGGIKNGVNMYLDPDSRRNAELVMAAWETNGGVLSYELVKTTIEKDTWYSVSLVIDSSGRGTLTGYVDGVEFDQVEVAFLPIKKHPKKNCIGGMREDTRLFHDGETTGETHNGLHFKGRIAAFRLFNSVERPIERPVLPTVSPSHAPSTSPSSIPTDMPTIATPSTTTTEDNLFDP